MTIEKDDAMTPQNTSVLRQLFSQKHDNAATPVRHFDVNILLLSVALMAIGLVMVTSASMPIAARLFDDPFHFAIRHSIYIGLASIAAFIVMQIPMQWWRVINPWLLLGAALMLVLVLFIGNTRNGATRWLGVGPITIQVAEVAKLCFFCYLAGYLVRRYEEVTENLKGFIKPLIVFFVLALLLLMQPDLGTVVVMFATTIGLLFLAGAKLWQFFGLVITGLAAIVALIFMETYRIERLAYFLDPWKDPFGKGYQLTQSLMAFGRGDWFGQGLGNSLQKLEYLPEAHNDFIMAILAEEMGFFGLALVLAIMFALCFKALKLGNLALANERPFDAYLAYAIGIWFSFQTAVNVGASAGIIPTKGLTLPLVSYGGSSMIIMAVAVALLLRIDFEIRVDGVQAMSKARKRKSAKGKSKVKKLLDNLTPSSADENQGISHG